MEQPPNNKEILEIVDLAKNLENSEDEEYIKENLPIFFEKLEGSLSIKITDNINSLYRKMTEENCLARIESISKVVAALEIDQPIEVGEGDSHYANAVIPEGEGIQLAFSEGQAGGPMRLMIGFGKTLIGFKTDHIEVKPVDFTESDIRDAAKRSYLCRHVDGRLSKEDLKAVIMRIPRHLMTKNLSKEESSNEQPFIFRGFLLNEVAG